MNGSYLSHGTRLSFRDSGAGLPLVFLHPTPLDGDYWRPLTEDLAGVRAIIPDLRGHGQSALGENLPVGGFAGVPDAPVLTMAQLADDVVALLDHLNVKDAVFAGCSIGGYVLLELWRRAPERMRGLAFVCSKPQPDAAANLEKRVANIALARAGGSAAMFDGMAQSLTGATARQRRPEIVAELRARMMLTPEAVVAVQAGLATRPDSVPAVGTIDLRGEKSRGSLSRGGISRQMFAAMTAALDEGGQVILLLNRRGFSTHIQCPACGHVVRCPECDIALTHHRTEEIALCHYCDYEVPAPTKCTACDFVGIRYSGLGTQRLEAEVRARFPNVMALRMDTDTMQAHGSHERALAAFRSGKVRILLGTQMIAKGLDFPNVTLVGVINADTALHLPDFRAAERTFQLVTQVAGRTGRGPKGGRVLVQTFSPDHPAIQAAIRHDYAAFAKGELPIREMLHYPPFAAMVRLVIRGPVEAIASQFALQLAERLTSALEANEAIVAKKLSQV